MQTLLNTHSFGPYAMWQRICTRTSYGFSAGFTLLLLLLGFAQCAAAADFSQNSVTIASNGGRDGGTNNPQGTYFTNVPGSPSPKYTTAISNLGLFDRGTGSLTLGAASVTTEASTETVTSLQLLYRVYQVTAADPTGANATKPGFLPLVLQASKTTVNGDGSKIREWTSTNAADVLNAAPVEGNYVLEFFFQLVSTNNQDNTVVTTINDSNNNNFYAKPFSVRGSQRATWLGKSTNWADGSNWTSGSPPNSTTDVTIPYLDGNGDYVERFPDITEQNVDVRTLVLLGDAGGSDKAQVTITSGRLRVYGDFRDANGGFVQNGGTFVLAGTTQSFDGGVFTDMLVQGEGSKTLTNLLTVNGSLTFVPSATGSNIVTSTANPNNSNVTLGPDAVIINESANGYVLGYLRTNRLVTIGTANDFGGIGLSLTTASSSSALAFRPTITRLTGRAYTGVGSKQNSITRSYTIIPGNSATYNYTLSFSYFNAELNGNSVAYLNAYSSPSNNSTFTMMTRVSSSGQMVTARASGRLSATFTLAENGPLPVTLTSFTATATAQGTALLRWITANESNNRGFGIERQLNSGEAWQAVGFVAAGATTGSAYEYTDKSLATAPASGKAYYRLRQEDLDGTVTYSPVAVISRSAAVAATELTLSPVPVSGTDNLSVGLAEAGQAGILVAVVNTQGQRVLNLTTQASGNGTLSLPVASLAAGVYIVTVQVPGQAARHARFVKL